MRPPHPPEQEVYEPKPLEELDDQEAMAASGVMAAPKKPVYIVNREDLHFHHPYYVNFKNPGRWQFIFRYSYSAYRILRHCLGKVTVSK